MKQLRKDWIIMLLACYAGGLAVSLLLFWPDSWEYSRFDFAIVMLLAPFVFGAVLFVPVGTFVIGLIRIRRRGAEAASLDDTLADVEPEIAERKLREYVALKQGLGARIAMGDTIQAIDADRATYTLPDDDPRGLPRVQS